MLSNNLEKKLSNIRASTKKLLVINITNIQEK